jgi:DinB superfamily
MQNLQYPIGEYVEQPFSLAQLDEWLLDIEVLPKALEFAITNLDATHLEQPYRPGGWKLKQVVHHVADSHTNAFIRLKLALTEDNPTLKPYDQDAWVLLADTEQVPTNVSITLLYALHTRMLAVLKSMKETDWQKTLWHPEYKKTYTLWYMLGLYAWHGKHHTAHITSWREREGV